MTLYKVAFTVPASTPKDNPYVERLQISENFLQRIYIRIPYGHRGVAHMHIRYGLDLFAPQPTWITKPDGTREKQKLEELWIEGDNEVLDFPVYYDAPEVPWEIVLEGWNESEHWDHTFYVYIVAMDKKQALPSVLLEELVHIIREITGV